MKGWLVSLGVHLLLVLGLWWSAYPTAPKTIPKKPIQAFTYTPPKAAVQELPPAVRVTEHATPAPAPAKPVKPQTRTRPEPTTKATTPPARAAATAATEVRSLKQATPPAAPATRGSLASRALSSATRSVATSSPGFREQQAKQDARLTAPSTAPATRPAARTIKKLSNGAELVKTADGSCWQLPSVEQRKNAIWTGSSIPCEPDTTVEQLNEIFKKRRELRRD